MKNNKAVGPDQIPSEFWKEMGAVGFMFLVTLFNKILRGAPMPEAFRTGFFLPFYKGKGDPRSCMNFRTIKLMCHTLKVYERVMYLQSTEVDSFGV